MDFGFSEICQNPAYCFFCFFFGVGNEKGTRCEQTYRKKQKQVFPLLAGRIGNPCRLGFYGFRIHSVRFLQNPQQSFDRNAFRQMERIRLSRSV